MGFSCRSPSVDGDLESDGPGSGGQVTEPHPDLRTRKLPRIRRVIVGVSQSYREAGAAPVKVCILSLHYGLPTLRIGRV